MCAFCAMLSGETHWTEAGTDSDAGAAAADSGRARYLDRNRRVDLINRILGFYGFTVSDWANNRYVLRNATGRITLVEHLPQIWMAAEEILGRPLDPLDTRLLGALDAAAPKAVAPAYPRG